MRRNEDEPTKGRRRAEPSRDGDDDEADVQRGGEEDDEDRSLGSSPECTAASALVMCGRGDKRTKKGKRFKGSYGNSRPKKDKMIERIKDRVEQPEPGTLPPSRAMKGNE